VSEGVSEGALCTFPFVKKYCTEMERPWARFPPQNVRAARISPYIEHLHFRSSTELAIILTILLGNGKMDMEFIKGQLDIIRKNDLNPGNLHRLGTEQLVKKLSVMKVKVEKTLQGIITKWYCDRYDPRRLHLVHHGDLVSIFSAFLGESPNGNMKEFFVEQAVFEFSKTAKLVREDIRK